MAKKISSGVAVGRLPQRPGIHVGKPSRILLSSARARSASCGSGISYGGVGGGFSTAQTNLAGYNNFYSPQLSTDFLELPQSRDERNQVYRFFYRSDPFVGQAIDLITEIPLSKIRLGMPKALNMEMARQSQRFCEKWARRVDLPEKLGYILHDYNLYGEAWLWAEDASPDMPQEVRYQWVEDEPDEKSLSVRVVSDDGTVIGLDSPDMTGLRLLTLDDTESVQPESSGYWEERPDADERHAEWNRKNYHGWTSLQTLPGSQIHVESFAFTDQKIAEFIPDAKTKKVIEDADSGDEKSQKIVASMSPDLVEAIRKGGSVPLNMDPDAGSFLYCLSRKKSQWEDRGYSVLERCIRTLVHRDKLRQAQASIASRHMTPIRIVWVEDGDEADVEDLREQVDLALVDPDYSIIANYQVQWEEMGVDGRLLDLSSEYDLSDRQLYSGLGVTESLLSGEQSYSGERINLDVINERFMLVRERLQTLVEEFLFKPMCARMGFVEQDEDGEDRVLYPSLSFTRLGLRDTQDTYDAMFNLYQKGSLDVDTIYDLLNLDGELIRERLNRDKFTLNDSTFNELLRSLYSRLADTIAEQSNALQFVAETLGLTIKPPTEEGSSRF